MITKGTGLINSFDFIPALNTSNSSNVSKSEDSASFSDLLSKSSNMSNSKEYSKPLQDVSAKKETPMKQKDLSNPKESAKNVSEADKQATVNTKPENAVVSQNEQTAQLVKDTKDIIKETLSLSDEELENIMEVLGLTMVDLFNPASLQQLVLASNGNEDMMSLLTNEDLANTFKELIDSVNGLLEEAGITVEALQETIESDDFLAFLEKFTMVEESPEEIAEFSTKMAVNSNDKEPSKSKAVNEQGTDEVPDENNEKSIAFSVERSDDSGMTESHAGQQEGKGLQKEDAATANQFLDQVAASVSTTTTTDFSGQLSTITTIREIANQIVEEIKVVIRPTQTSMEMQLNPENLGKVSLSISSKEGVMTAHFITQSELAKEAIESQMQVLRQNLENQGIKIEAIEVTVSNFSFDQSGGAKNNDEAGANKGKKAFRIDADDDIDTIMDTSQLASGLVDESNSSVDYSA